MQYLIKHDIGIVHEFYFWLTIAFMFAALLYFSQGGVLKLIYMYIHMTFRPQVRWDNSKRGNYRFGLFGKYDIEVW